jgi:hypothetical protein
MQRIGKYRTVKGIELQREHDERYKKMLIGKTNNWGKIINAEWIGNSVYGIVKLYFENGETNLYSNPNGFRPRKEDFNLI